MILTSYTNHAPRRLPLAALRGEALSRVDEVVRVRGQGCGLAAPR